MLTKLDGKCVAEAAEIAGTTVGAMKVRAHRGYEALRKLLGGRQGGGGRMSRRCSSTMLDAPATARAAPPRCRAALEAELGKLAPVAPRRPLRQLAILAGISLVYGAGLVAALACARTWTSCRRAGSSARPLAWLARLCRAVLPRARAAPRAR